MNNEFLSLEPMEPRGWFRWLDHHYWLRMRCEDRLRESHLYSTGLGKFFEGLKEKALDLDEIEVLRRQRSAFGYYYFVRFWSSDEHSKTRPFLKHFSPLERGDFWASVSEALWSEEITPSLRSDAWDAIQEALESVALSHGSATQLACNAIRMNRFDVFEKVLRKEWDKTKIIPAADPFGKSTNPYDDDPQEDSWNVDRRGIDSVLYAALLVGHEKAVHLTLTLGANPGQLLWRVERSYSGRITALRHAIENSESGEFAIIVEHFLKAGANPRGEEFEGYGFPLFQALSVGSDEVADLLLKFGAIFETTNSMEVRWFLPESKLDPEKQKLFDDLAATLSLIPESEKAFFHEPNAQGGWNRSYLSAVIRNPDRMEKYKSKGIDLRLTRFELREFIAFRYFDGLKKLFELQGLKTPYRILETYLDQREKREIHS